MREPSEMSQEATLLLHEFVSRLLPSLARDPPLLPTQSPRPGTASSPLGSDNLGSIILAAHVASWQAKHPWLFRPRMAPGRGRAHRQGWLEGSERSPGHGRLCAGL